MPFIPEDEYKRQKSRQVSGFTPASTGGFTPASTEGIPLVPSQKEPGLLQSMAQGIAQPFGKLASTIASAGSGIFNLGQAGMAKLQGDEEEYRRQLRQAGTPVKIKAGYLGEYEPIKSTKESIGVGAEIGLTAAPFFKGLLGGKLLQQTARLSGWAAALGASQATEEGKDIKGIIKQAGIGAATGAVLGPLSKGTEWAFTKAIKGLPSIFSITTAGQKKAFEFQLKNPRLAKTAVKAGKNADEIARGMTNAIKKYQADMGNEYQKGIQALAKKYPKKLFTPDRYWFPSKQIDNIFNQVGNKFDVQVTQKGLQFSRAGRISSIAKGTEQTRIKEIYSALKNWRDFSAEGSSKLLNYLNKLRKFETTQGTRESAFVSEILKEVKKPIFQRWQGMEGIFNNYANKVKFADEIASFLKATKQADAQAQVGAARNIMKIFDTDKEPLFRMAERFERETGVSILAELSAAELSSSFPPIIRSVLGVGALTQIFSPTLILALPLFIQRVAAAMTRTAGRVLPRLPLLQSIGAKTGTYLGEQIGRSLSK